MFRNIYKLIVGLAWILSGFSFASCKTKKAPNNATLIHTYWKLSKLNGQEVTTPPGEKVAYIMFDYQHCISGFSGCNKIEGSFHTDERTISIQLERPKRLCPDMQLDSAFRNVLQKTNLYFLEGRRLLLFQDNIYLAEFEAPVKR